MWKEFTTAELPEVEIINKQTKFYQINGSKNFYLSHGIFENFNSHAINITNVEKSNYILLSDCFFTKFNMNYDYYYPAMINIKANSNVIIYRTCTVDVSKNSRTFEGIFAYCYPQCQRLFLKDTTIAKCGPNENEQGKSCIYFSRSENDNILRFSLDRVNLTKNNAYYASAIDIKKVDGEVKYTTIDNNYAATNCIIYHWSNYFKYSYCNFIDNRVWAGTRAIIWNQRATKKHDLYSVYATIFQGTAYQGSFNRVDTPRDQHPSLSYLKSYKCFALAETKFENFSRFWKFKVPQLGFILISANKVL